MNELKIKKKNKRQFQYGLHVAHSRIYYDTLGRGGLLGGSHLPNQLRIEGHFHNRNENWVPLELVKEFLLGDHC